MASPGHYFLSIEDDETGEKVGLAWFGVKHPTLPRSGYFYDFFIYDEHRKKGFGKQMLQALHGKAKELGVE